MKAQARVADISRRTSEWVDGQDPASHKGAAIDAWRRYQAVEGPLQSALLSLYLLVAVLPALLVLEEYLDSNPAALANHLVHHYHLNTATGGLLHNVLGGSHKHKLGSALFAIVGSLFFGLAFGRVMQNVQARAWRIEIKKSVRDQFLYALVLLGIYGLIALLLVQLTALKGSPRWVGWTLALGWTGLLTLFFVWLPSLLLHKQISRRDLLPGAVLTAFGLVLLMLISSLIMQFWVDLYARDYGGLGVVLAIYFWIAFSSAVIVMAASISPALAQRRRLTEAATVIGQSPSG